MKNDWKFLVVEDIPDSQEVVTAVLEHLNLSYDLAADAEQAEQFLFKLQVPYTAILIDLALPGKDGWELLSEIQQHPQTSSIPCIAITAYHSSKTREQALLAGFNAYFSKPLDTTAFARHLEALL